MGAEVSPITAKEWWAAQQGAYYVAITPTPGTGVAGHAAPTTFDQAKPLIVVFNDTKKYCYPQFLHLHLTAAPTNGARVQFTHTLDNGNRRSSDGTAMTIANTNSGFNNNSGVSAWIGAVVGTTATTSVRITGNVVYRGTIGIIEDDYFMIWGAPNAMSGSTSRVATVAEASRILPPVAIAPGDSLCITQWAADQTGALSAEAVLGFVLL